MYLKFGVIVAFFALFSRISCDLKTEFVDVNVPNSAIDDKLHDIHIETGANKTNVSVIFASKLDYCENSTLKRIQGSLKDFEEEIELENQLRGKLCMENLTQCMNNDPEYEPTMKQLLKFLLGTSPPFDLSNVEGVSEGCKMSSRRYIEDLKSYQYWALGMYDATAKIASGFLSGNINQLGDFDLCQSSRLEEANIYGKYCLAALQIETPHNPYLSAIHNRLYAHQSFKSKLGDPGHRVPRFSSINWGICVPDQCTARDVELGFRKAIDGVLATTALEYKMEVDGHMCTTSKPKSTLNYRFIIGCAFFASVIFVALISTGYDYLLEGQEQKNEVLMAFSLKRNVTSMISMEEKSNDLEAVHGIRCFNALMLLFSHKSMALLFLPYVNRTQMSEIIGQTWTVIGRAASLYTDPFIMLSGTLTAYSLYGRLQKNVKISILEEYASRLFRIVPTFGALILFCTFVLPYVNSGPMWNMVVQHHADICQYNWWRNLMFIHNYFGFKDMCLTHTHHIGIDTQLFFVSPFLILLLWKWPKQGAMTLFTLGVISTIMRYYVTYTRKLSNYVHFGTSIEQLFNTADYMYILPAHRFTVYVMGIFLGCILRNCKNVVLRPYVLHMGNILAVISFLIAFIGPAFMGNINYVYQPIHAAWYAAFAPIFWCLTFAWIVFTCHIGHKGLIGQICCLPYFKIWTKISYTVYLTQFPIFFYNVGTTRHSEYYEFIPKNLNILELSCIIAASMALTLLFEMPFQNLKSVIFKKKHRVRQPETAKKIS